MKIIFEVGDIVVLKSGGPSMTVTKVTEDDCIETVWFDASVNKPSYSTFPVVTLRPGRE